MRRKRAAGQMRHGPETEPPGAPPANARDRVGARRGQSADGPEQRDLSCAAAVVHDGHAGLAGRRSGRNRRNRRSDRVDDQIGVGAIVRPQPAKEAFDPVRLWPRGSVEIAVSDRQWRASGTRRAVRRPDRQGHQRSAARRDDRRSDPARDPRARVRAAPVARHCRSVPRTARGDRADVLVGQRHSRGVLDRGDPGLAVVPVCVDRVARNSRSFAPKTPPPRAGPPRGDSATDFGG